MRIGVLGTGDVGRRLATALLKAGHEVTLGSRTASNAAAVAWASEHQARQGTFADAADDAAVVINATSGLHSIDALGAAGDLTGKIIMDVANALDFSGGFPPKVDMPDGLSLAERIQTAFPQAKVVKTLQTMNNTVMVEPALVDGDHTVFLHGDDAAAKELAAGLLHDLGWAKEQILDLGPLATARATEQLMPLWLALYAALGTETFNLGVHRARTSA